MISKGSRYAQVPVRQATVGGREISHLGLRLLPDPPAATTHRVDQNERLDQIAYRYFQDPTQFWRVCDANRAMLPSLLVDETGRVIKVPLAK